MTRHVLTYTNRPRAWIVEYSSVHESSPIVTGSPVTRRARETKDVKKHRVRDGDRVLEFEGRLLARETSHEEGKRRWIDLALYRTRAGTYVLEGVGRSLVPGEVDRCWAQLADEPEGIIDRLYLYNDLGAKYIPHTSRALLVRAGECDDVIRRAFAVERVA